MSYIIYDFRYNYKLFVLKRCTLLCIQGVLVLYTKIVIHKLELLIFFILFIKLYSILMIKLVRTNFDISDHIISNFKKNYINITKKCITYYIFYI